MKKFIFSFVLLGLFACSHTKTILIDSSMDIHDFDKQGHRGCRGLMPENTIPAMLHALDLGVTTLEMDVCITKDKKVIVFFQHFVNGILHFSAHFRVYFYHR